MKKKKPIPRAEVDRLVAKAIARLSTEKGQAELKAAFERGAQAAREIRENARVDPAMLKIPFGPRTRDGRWPTRKVSKEAWDEKPTTDE
jgi:hypothetical protein